jgi:UDP-GlcNAc:undecaprenyl-phosphate GlcNAc-1-phosphate transferase
VLAALFSSFLVAFLVTPIAIHVARATGFLDRPRGYKGHAEPTPYLGGAAVLAGFAGGAIVGSELGGGHFAWLFAGGAFLWAVGTSDDRVGLGAGVRVVAEALAGIALWHGDMGWSIFSSDAANLGLTIAWVVGLVNAFNLMDNIDGAAATVAAVSALGIALLAGSNDVDSVATLCLAVAGSCAGFLRYNLAQPARIFLGDGGSMLLGFLVAALSMTAWRDAGLDGVDLLPMIMMAGLPVLDMTLVIISRLRRGVPVGKGGRDHTTHRLRLKLGSTRLVALALASAQAALCLIAIEITSWSTGPVLVACGLAFALGVATIAVLELPTFTAELPNRRDVPPALGAADGPAAGQRR